MDQTVFKPWHPPADYQSATSAIEGITVFAPRPPEEKAQQPVEYKCPNCGATTRYDVAAGGVACEYCGYKAPVQEAKVGLAAPEYEFTLETLSKAETGWGITRQELHCESCGASLIIPPGALTTSCPFCASNSVNVREAPADVLRPRFLVPFRVKTDDLSTRAGEWLGKGWFHPPELKASSIIERFSGLYMPFWTFHAKVNALWRAEVGYERQDRYFDAGSHSWKTRVKIDWRWENGQVSQETDNLLVAGTHRVSQKILSQVRNFNLDELVNYSPDYLAGWQAQTYDIGLTDAWESGKQIFRENARDGCYAEIPSPHVRNFSMTADFDDESWRFVLLPVYVSAYRFMDKTYTVMANGQTGLIAGQKPVVWWKVWLAILALLAPGLVIGVISLPLLLVGGVGLIPLFIALILLVIGGAISAGIYRQAVSSEAA